MENKSVVMEAYDCKRKLYENFALEVEHLLRRMLAAENINCNAITSRLKDRDSLSEKIDRKQDKYACLEDLTDIAGIRVITYYNDDVDKVAEIVEREFVVDRENSIDKREALEPDRFGYCSVHYVVEMNGERLNLRENQPFKGLKCEIQIRSVLQHAWAEIEHDLGYKSEITIPKNIRRNFSRLAGMLEIADKEFQEIRESLTTYKAEVTEKIEDNKLQDVEIDAISLEAFTKADKNIIKINTIIEELFGKALDEDLPADEFEHTIKQLHWFGVYTMDQLPDFIEKNSEHAVNIAKKLIKKDPCGDYTVPITIALFYLCYAELLMRHDTMEPLVEYLEANNIGRDFHDTATQLLQIRNDLNMV